MNAEHSATAAPPETTEAMREKFPFRARRSFKRLFQRTRAWAVSLLALGAIGPAVAQPAGQGSAAPAPAFQVAPADQQRIEEALPDQAFAQPGRPRRLLIFELNVGYGGHPSMAHASRAFARMGEKTGAFATVVSRDPAVFAPESLRRFDAVFFNNTVGNLFEDPKLRQSLVEFVYGGGGLLGVHGTSVAFTRWPGAIEDWPEFGVLLGARGANHRESTELVFAKLDDPGHPLNQVFAGQGFEYRDEFFRFQEVYSRRRVRVLLSIDTAKTDTNRGEARGNCIRPDNDYALAWVRNYGRGRVFYSTIAHNPYVFWDPNLLRFYLGALQFALGDLPAPATPSAKLTPAVRAQERLGWRLGLQPAGPAVPGSATVFEAADAAAALGLSYLGVSRNQKVSREIDQPFDERLGNAELSQIRLKLDAVGVRLLTYDLPSVPADENGCRRVFAFARRCGIETLIAAPPVSQLSLWERLCDEYELNLALVHLPRGKGQVATYSVPWVAKHCANRSQRLGAFGDAGDWMRSGVDPVKAVRTLGTRLITLQLQDGRPSGPRGHAVTWGTGAGKTELVLRELQRAGVRPTMISLKPAPGSGGANPDPAGSIAFFNQVSVRLAE